MSSVTQQGYFFPSVICAFGFLVFAHASWLTIQCTSWWDPRGLGGFTLVGLQTYADSNKSWLVPFFF